MGVLPKNRKRKFNKSGAPNPNNKVNDAEIIKDTNENDASKVNTKKANKNISVMSVESKNDNDISEVKAKKKKIVKMPKEEENLKNEDNMIAAKKVKKNVLVEPSGDAEDKGITEEMMSRYPILKDQEMIKKFQAVNLTNNQKGRLRLSLRQQLQGTSDALLPDAINTKIQAILKTESPNLIKLRILFNMLKTALQGKKTPVKKEKQPVKRDIKQKQKKNDTEDGNDKDKKPEQKVKGPKRYVVFIGNLALDISKEKILEHFSDLSDKIKDVRIPKPLQNKKSSIAYLEVADEVSYELALSKHHSMLDNRRINVLYSTQKNSKISKAEAKGKAAKLVAMQKSGQLAGSAPLSKKRSARRKKMKLAQKAKEAAERGA